MFYLFPATHEEFYFVRTLCILILFCSNFILLSRKSDGGAIFCAKSASA